jgi:hypothetical protein
MVMGKDENVAMKYASLHFPLVDIWRLHVKPYGYVAGQSVKLSHRQRVALAQREIDLMSGTVNPTVGRVVQYFHTQQDRANGLECYDETPCDAHIVYVHDGVVVNLVVFDHRGSLWKIESVPSKQDRIDGSSYWDWPMIMPVRPPATDTTHHILG